MTEKIDDLLELVGQYADPQSVALVERSIALAESVLAKASISHPRIVRNQAIAAAKILAELHVRVESVVAALLVEVPADLCSPEQIIECAGQEVNQLVAGVHEMRALPYLSSENKLSWSEKKRSELYHAFVASLDTPQLILIELAHQLYKLRRLADYFSPEQRSIVFDAMEIYAPLAHRLGIWRIKWELEDRALRFTHPDAYHQIAAELNEQRATREQDVQTTVETLQQQLEENGIEAEISGRPKHIYSIYRKMQRKGVPIEAVYDIQALRVLVDNEATCYRVLSIIHRLWTPIPDQFDDYIANPKPNGYQSLHTAVMDPEGNSFEVQIRTWDMHQAAELGVAAHWRYKERHGSKQAARKKKDLMAEQAIEEKISWLRMLLDDTQPNGRLITHPKPAEKKGDEPIFVFSPGGDVIRLPSGATPIDFAYRIHTELGHRCSGAKVNGNIVPLDYQLSNGDRIEIITQKRGGPNIQWLSKDERFVKTPTARKKINAWFRSQQRKKNVARGHEVLDRELAKVGLKSSVSFDQVAQLFNLENGGELLAQVGGGLISTEKLQAALTSQPRPSQEELAREADEELVSAGDQVKTLIDKTARQEKTLDSDNGEGLLVASIDGVHSRLARCCYPVPHEKIVGYVTRGHGATIHLANCPNIASAESERLVPAAWGKTEKRTYPVMVMVEAVNRRGLMGDIGQAVSKEKVDIHEARVKRRTQWAVFELLLEVTDADQLERVLVKLGKTKDVRTVYRQVG